MHEPQNHHLEILPVRASQENIPLIEFLVKSGALVAYKTNKHNRTSGRANRIDFNMAE